VRAAGLADDPTGGPALRAALVRLRDAPDRLPEGDGGAGDGGALAQAAAAVEEGARFAASAVLRAGETV